METYIVNLTNNLISKNRLDIVFLGMKDSSNPKEFLDFAQTQLEFGDVALMSPEKLGKIMCSFYVGDVMASKMDLAERMTFVGNCGEMLRTLVAACLAYAILARLQGGSIEKNIPAYTRTGG